MQSQMKSDHSRVASNDEVALVRHGQQIAVQQLCIGLKHAWKDT